MAGHACKFCHFVGKSTLDKHGRQIFCPVKFVPNIIGGRRISRDADRDTSIRHHHPCALNVMIDGDRHYGQTFYLKRFACRVAAIFHDRSIGILQFRKLRIDGPIKNIAFKYVDHLTRRVYPNRLRQGGKKIIDEKRQAGNVVEMYVGKYYIADLLPLLARACKRKATGIHGNMVVDNDARQMLPLGCGTVTFEGGGQILDLH